MSKTDKSQRKIAWGVGGGGVGVCGGVQVVRGVQVDRHIHNNNNKIN